MVKTLNKCILSISVCTLFLDIQRNTYLHRNISIHQSSGCLHKIEIRKSDVREIGQTLRSNIYIYIYTKLCYSRIAVSMIPDRADVSETGSQKY